MIINDLDGYYIVFDTKNWNTELDTLETYSTQSLLTNCRTLLLSRIQQASAKLRNVFVKALLWC